MASKTISLPAAKSEATIVTLQSLKSFGVRLEMDDFGTGYSSLRYLSRFPIDTVKIDQAFVRGISKNSEDRAIIQSIVALAHNLGLGVTAEGVETEEQLEFLKELGCDHGQGFIFGRPMESQKLENLIGDSPSWETILSAD